MCGNLNEIYFMGDRMLWESVYIDSYGNDCIKNGYVNCDMKAVAEISELSVSGSKVTGKIVCDYLLCDMTVAAGLYNGEKLVDIVCVPLKAADGEAEFSLEGVSGNGYEIRVFFWNFNSFTPNGKIASELI